MILSIGLAVLAAACAFVMGYALNQGTTCAVTAARQVIDDRQPTMLLGFGVAAATAGLVWLPLAWMTDGAVTLTPDHRVGGGLILGSMLLGLGAVMNRACLLGSVSRIGDGRLSYLGLPVGLAAGFVLGDRLGLSAPGAQANLLGRPSEIAVLVLVAFGVLVWVGWWSMRRLGDAGGEDRWSWRTAMAVLGISGAVLFAVAPGWTLADAIRLAVPGGVMVMMTAGALGLLMFAILSGGAMVSGIRRRSFVLRPPRLVAFSRSILGGAVMALGANLVPGGNDTLLLAAVPGATLAGLVAYLVMSTTVFALLFAGSGIRRARARGAFSFPPPPPPGPSAPERSRARRGRG